MLWDSGAAFYRVTAKFTQLESGGHDFGRKIKDGHSTDVEGFQDLGTPNSLQG